MLEQYPSKQRYLFLLCMIVIGLAIFSGCNSANAVSTDMPIAPNPTDTAAFLPSPTLAPYPGKITPSSPPVLPHALYFLAGLQESSQVWRIGTDGVSKMQITHVEKGVEAFAVSPANGEIAFISDNQLFLMNNDGDSPSLVADGQAVDKHVEDYAFRSWVSSPIFSPDGRTLAYGFDGLHLHDLATGEDTHVLTNLGNLLGEPFVFSREAYSPGAWSPDGSLLLIIMGYYEGSTLAVMDPDEEQPFRRLWSEGPVCCMFSWSADGSSILAANPTYSTDVPGLWRFDVETGKQSVLVPGYQEDGSMNFAGWPIQLAPGDLYFFHVNLEQFSPDTGIPLTMVRSDMDGSHKEQVRPETFRIIDVLWTQDGSAALILQMGDNENVEVILAHVDGSPLQVLFKGKRVRNLMWGP